MRWLVLTVSALSVWLLQDPLDARRAEIDVSAVTVGASSFVAELDLGKLKGDLRQVGWSPDGSRLYVQTADGRPPSLKEHHYWIAIEGGAVLAIDRAPDWAQTYWAAKSDRFAPGLGSIVIDVDQKMEVVKFGTGSAGLIEPGDRAGNGSIGAENVDRAAQSQHATVVRLVVFGETISEFVNQQPVPGLMFGWGPSGSAAIAYTTRDGDLLLLDRQKHRRAVQGAHDALLPAWSLDGTRLAWVQKSGRRKYGLYWAPVTMRR